MSIEELKSSLAKRKTLNKLILAILFLVQKDLITKDPILFNKAFLEMKKEIPMPLLQSLIFDESTPNPFSEELEEALFQLEASGILTYFNGNYDIGSSRTSQVEAYLLFDGEQEQIIECAKRLCKYLPQD